MKKEQGLTPRDAEKSEIGFEPIQPEESGAGKRVVTGDADEGARVEKVQGGNGEESEGEEDEAEPERPHPGQVVRGGPGRNSDLLVLLLLGLLVVVGGVRRRFVVEVFEFNR